MRKSVRLANQAIDNFKIQNNVSNRLNRFVALSMGSYGAYLSNKSEYTGDYGHGTTEETIYEFHCDKLNAVINEKHDYIPFESIPSKIETLAILRILRGMDATRKVWISYTCNRNTEFASIVRLLAHEKLNNHAMTLYGIGIISCWYVIRILKLTGLMSGMWMSISLSALRDGQRYHMYKLLVVVVALRRRIFKELGQRCADINQLIQYANNNGF
jgi:hypothetical protein